METIGINELIKSAKVTLIDKGKRSRNGDIIRTMIIEFETGYRTEWDWVFPENCTPEKIAHQIEHNAYNAYRELHKDCSQSPCNSCMQGILNNINSPNFAYARFTPCGLGNYYKIYHRDNTSPTGVILAGGCSEKIWEQISKKTGNSHNYYSPSENKMSAR